MSNRITSLIASLGLFISVSTPALSAPSESGDLDQRFGEGGLLNVGFGNGAHLSPDIWGSAIQSDGKILVLGQESFNSTFLVHRFLPDGTTDSSFGDSGNVRTVTEPDSFEQAYSVACRPDGKIVVCGSSEGLQGSSLVLVRYEQDGSLDSSFGQGGILRVTSPEGEYVSASVMTLLSDGRILVASTIDRGMATRLDLALLRFSEDGKPDESFGNGGVAIHDLGSSNNDFPGGIAVQGDGNVLVTGSSSLDLFVARFLDDGSFESTFGSGGVVIGNYGFGNFGSDILVRSDGKILVGGCTNCFRSDLQDFLVLSLDDDGSPDNGFGSNGVALIDIAERDSVDGLSVQSDGKLIVSGTTFIANEADFVVARLLTDGSLDPAFQGGGVVITDFGGSDQNRALVEGPQETLLLVGDSQRENTRIALARYDRDGNLDPSLHGDGLATQVVFGPTNDAAQDIAIQPNGRVVTVGRSSNNVSQAFGVARVLPNGTPDKSFGNAGAVTFFFPNHESSSAQSVALQRDGKIVAAGSAFSTTDWDDFALVRFMPDGSLDPTFGTKGWVATDLDGQDDDCRSVAIQANGRIVAAGRTELDSGRSIALVGYDRWGNVDPGFGQDGSVIVEIPGSESDLREIAIHPSGDIYGVGSAGPFMVVVRLSSEGVLLNQAILTFQNFFGITRGRTLAIQPNGRILVGGRTDLNGDPDFAIARLLPNLQLDATFGRGGEVIAGWPGLEDDGRSLVLAEGGHIVLAGNSDDGLTNEFAALLLRPDGSIRTDFQVDGWLLTSVNDGQGRVRSTCIDPRGGLLIAGTTGGRTSDFVVARYLFQPRNPRTQSPSLRN